MNFQFPSKIELLACMDRVTPHVHKTPVLTSTLINQRTKAKLFFKCENFQKAGSYKIRGALNASLSLEKTKQANGILTHSSGNFAQAIALSGRLLNIPVYVVMPDNTPEIKKNAVMDYGAKVTICPPTLKDREDFTALIKRETNANFLHPSNHRNVILGQATCGIELIDQVNNLDVIIAPVGGGGILAGTCLAAKHFNSHIQVFGAEPMQADDAYQSLKKGEIVPSINPDTIADGLRTQLGDQNFPIIGEMVSDIIRVEEYEIIEAMRFVWERMKMIIEPSSAVTLAAVLKEEETFRDKNVGLIITGGNVDLSKLPFNSI